MEAIALNKYGNSSVLDNVEIEMPAYGASQVLIQVKASGINLVDAKVRAGILEPFMPQSFPLVLGWELSGIVAAIGSEVKNFKVGDEIYSQINMVQGGTYAEYAAVNESEVALKPKTLSYLQAAAVPMGGNTAYTALIKIADIQKGQKVLIHGAGGIVGRFAVQIAKLRGAYVIGTASGERIELVKSLGADEVIDYKTTDFEKVVQDVDMVLDLVGGETQIKSYSVIKKGGFLLSALPPTPTPEETEEYGAHPETRAQHSPELDPEKAAEFGIRAEYYMTAPDAAALTLLAQWIDDAKIKIPEPTVFTFSEAIKAHEILEKRTVKGKLVFEVQNKY